MIPELWRDCGNSSHCPRSRVGEAPLSPVRHFNINYNNRLPKTTRVHLTRQLFSKHCHHCILPSRFRPSSTFAVFPAQLSTSSRPPIWIAENCWASQQNQCKNTISGPQAAGFSPIQWSCGPRGGSWEATLTSGPYSCSSLTMLTANGNFCFAGSSQGTLKSSVKDVSIHLTTKPSSLKEKTPGDSPGGPDSKIQRSQCRGPGSILGRGTRSHRPQLRPGMAKYINTFF